MLRKPKTGGKLLQVEPEERANLLSLSGCVEFQVEARWQAFHRARFQPGFEDSAVAGPVIRVASGAVHVHQKRHVHGRHLVAYQERIAELVKFGRGQDHGGQPRHAPDLSRRQRLHHMQDFVRRDADGWCVVGELIVRAAGQHVIGHPVAVWVKFDPLDYAGPVRQLAGQGLVHQLRRDQAQARPHRCRDELDERFAVDDQPPGNVGLQSFEVSSAISVRVIGPVLAIGSQLRPGVRIRMLRGWHYARPHQSTNPVGDGLRQPRVVRGKVAGAAPERCPGGGDFRVDAPHRAHAPAAPPPGCPVETADMGGLRSAADKFGQEGERHRISSPANSVGPKRAIRWTPRGAQRPCCRLRSAGSVLRLHLRS